MIYQIDKITQDVRVCLDQNMDESALLAASDIETLAYDNIIRSKILESVRRVHSEAPIHLLESGHNFGDAVFWKELQSGYVQLPSDFLRLIVFEMDDWERACHIAISPDSPEYEKQRSRFKGIRGTSQKPVCAIVPRPEGLTLEFYSCKSEEATVSRAMYIPYPSIDEDGGVDISERCYPAVVYLIASLTLLTFGEEERARHFSDLANTLLGDGSAADG